MKSQELKDYINRTLGNSIRCLLPSYWWKRLFGLVVDKLEELSRTIDTLATKKYVDESVWNIAIHVDSTMSDTSTNPVQNKVVKSYIDGCTDRVKIYDVNKHSSKLPSDFAKTVRNNDGNFAVYSGLVSRYTGVIDELNLIVVVFDIFILTFDNTTLESKGFFPFGLRTDKEYTEGNRVIYYMLKYGCINPFLIGIDAISETCIPVAVRGYRFTVQRGAGYISTYELKEDGTFTYITE